MANVNIRFLSLCASFWGKRTNQSDLIAAAAVALATRADSGDLTVSNYAPDLCLDFILMKTNSLGESYDRSEVIIGWGSWSPETKIANQDLLYKLISTLRI